MEIRTVHEAPRGCGYRKEGGSYLTGEPGLLGTLPACVPVDPPIPVDQAVIPFTRGVYLVDLDAILIEDDQCLWLVDSSAESLRKRDDLEWERERYGIPLLVRLRTGICEGLDANDAEIRLHKLQPTRGAHLEDYILAITRAGRGRRIARETAKMQQARMDKDWMALLASCWRLANYPDMRVRKNLKRIMVSLGAVSDAVLV